MKPYFLDLRQKIIETYEENNLSQRELAKRFRGDNQIRNLLDPVPASNISRTFQKVYQWLKEKGVLQKFLYLDGEILVALDGTEYFSSKKINCPHCM